MPSAHASIKVSKVDIMRSCNCISSVTNAMRCNAVFFLEQSTFVQPLSRDGEWHPIKLLLLLRSLGWQKLRQQGVQ